MIFCMPSAILIIVASWLDGSVYAFFSDDFDVYAERSCVRPVAGVHVEASYDDVHVKGP